MKNTVLIAFILSLFLSFPLCCSAEETTDIYDDYLEQIGIEGLNDKLTDESNEILQNYDLSSPITSSKEMFSASNVFDIIVDFFKNNVKTPLTSGLIIISILLFSAAVSNIYGENKSLQLCVSVGVAAAALLPAVSVITACTEAIKTAGAFMFSFVPIMAVLLSAKGKPLTSVGFSGVMTIAVQAVTYICSFFILPLSCMQLSLGLSSSVSQDIKPLAISSAVKKVSTWTLSLICTVFLGVLGIQTAINSPADNLYSKTAKFVIGNAVPVVGNVVAESLNTVRGSFKLLSSSVAVYGIVAIVITVLPIVIELIIWRIVMLISHTVAEMLCQPNTAIMLKTVDQTFAFVLGITILIVVMFILSVGIVSVV